MPRRAKDSKQSSRLKLENLYRKCHYCDANRPTNRFDKHLKACKTQWEILRERKKIMATRLLEPKCLQQNEEFIQGSSAIMLVDMVDGLPVTGSATSPPNFDDTMATEQIGEYQHIL
jgi:hypothetical protein